MRCDAGYHRFAEDLYQMMGSKPNWHLHVCLRFIGPVAIIVRCARFATRSTSCSRVMLRTRRVLSTAQHILHCTALGALQILLIISIIDYEPPTYGSYEYPGWGLAVGWLITIWPVNVIPAYMLYYLIQKGSGQVRCRHHYSVLYSVFCDLRYSTLPRTPHGSLLLAQALDVSRLATATRSLARSLLICRWCSSSRSRTSRGARRSARTTIASARSSRRTRASSSRRSARASSRATTACSRSSPRASAAIARPSKWCSYRRPRAPCPTPTRPINEWWDWPGVSTHNTFADPLSLSHTHTYSTS